MPRMKTALRGVLCLVSLASAGCLSLGDREKEEDATTIRREVAELVKVYRLCLQKNEEDPAKAREQCSLYRDAIRDLSPDAQKSIVAELLDRLRDKTR